MKFDTGNSSLRLDHHPGSKTVKFNFQFISCVHARCSFKCNSSEACEKQKNICLSFCANSIFDSCRCTALHAITPPVFSHIQEQRDREAFQNEPHKLIRMETPLWCHGRPHPKYCEELTRRHAAIMFCKNYVVHGSVLKIQTNSGGVQDLGDITCNMRGVQNSNKIESFDPTRPARLFLTNTESLRAYSSRFVSKHGFNVNAGMYLVLQDAY